MSNDTLRRLMAIFRDEAHENLDELGQLLEQIRGTTGDALNDKINTAMRVAHNLKGASSSVGLESMAEMAHRFEDRLLSLRGGGESVEEIMPLCQRAIGAMQRLTDGETVDVAELLAALVVPGQAGPPEQDQVIAAPAKAERAGAPQVAQPEAQEATHPDDAQEPGPPEPGEGATAVSPLRRGVRVDAARLDDLARHASELLATEAAIANQSASIEALYESAVSQLAELSPEQQQRWQPWVESLEKAAQDERDGLRRMKRFVADLGEAIRRVRLLPLAALEPTWRRCIAETARVTGKEASLTVTSAGVELDKQVLDQLVEPLLHLLRNAVDHGLEAPAERERKGKPRIGQVRIAARMAGDQVELTVEDDGGGIDLDRLRAAALERGRTREQLERMSQRELLDIMFEPGLSTALEVSTVSGRGVGLDVVRRAVEELGGHIESTPSGRLGGAGFVLQIPVNILSTHALLFRAGRMTYALPVDGVVRTLRVAAGAFAMVEGDRVLSVDGHPLRLRNLAALLGQRSQPARTRANGESLAIVLQRGGRWLAVEVDEIIADQQLAIQRLPWNLRSVPGVSGAVALPGGIVVVALDIGHLLRTSGVSVAEERQAAPLGGRARRILVVDDSLTSRTLIRHSLEAAGYEVSAAEDGLQGWEALRSGDFSMLVSDVRMPRLDGIGLTQRVRGDDRFKTLPVILITTESTPVDVQRGLSAGADEYVIKGAMQQQKLLEAVTRHL